jgi:hypothetical protein
MKGTKCRLKYSVTTMPSRNQRATLYIEVPGETRVGGKTPAHIMIGGFDLHRTKWDRTRSYGHLDLQEDEINRGYKKDFLSRFSKLDLSLPSGSE